MGEQQIYWKTSKEGLIVKILYFRSLQGSKREANF